MMRIDGLLVSGMKSGSTWLAHQLAGQAGVCYIDSHDVKIDIGNRLISDIKAKVPSPGQITISRRNLLPADQGISYSEAYRRNNPAMKLVSLLRDPVSRTMSNIRHVVVKFPKRNWPASFQHALSFRRGKYILDINSLIALELEKRAGQRHDLLVRSFYRACFEPFVRHFPRDQFLIVPLCPGMTNLGESVRPVFDFLGLTSAATEPSLANGRINESIPRHRGIKAWIGGYVAPEIIEANSDCINALQAEFLDDAKCLDSDFGTRAVEIWGLEK
jgi:hypothetical protein